jgi:nickel/cobalt transporter (NicO) family protein
VRTARRLAALTVLGFSLLVMTAGVASAHPLGNFTINTYDGIVVVPGEVQVTYVLDMAEIPTFQLGRALDADGDGIAGRAELAAFAGAKARELLPGIRVTSGGRVVRLAVRSSSASLRPGQAGLHTLRLEALYAGPIGGAGDLTVSDRTYADHIGWHEITALGARGAVVSGSSVPTETVSDALLHYPKDLLSSPLDVTSARFSFQPGTSGAAPGVPAGGDEGDRPGVAGGAFARLATWTGLSVPALLLALLLAAAFGAGHALLPGHGKTLIAAYLVGQGGRLRQAAQVGVAVAFMHSASVLALGLAVLGLEVVAPDRIYPWVTLATGVLVIAMGAALTALRVRDARRGVGHTHEHDHQLGPEAPHGHEEHAQTAIVEARVPVLAGVGAGGTASIPVAHSIPASWNGHAPATDELLHRHTHPVPSDRRPVLDRPLSRRGLAGLAVAGGILPSPTAIVVLLATFSAHRVAFGLALIASFSAGMAAALIGVGFVAVRARTVVSKRLSGRLLWALPVSTAIVIVGVGVYLTIRGAAGI